MSNESARTGNRAIEYLSPPEKVSMADAWYEHATPAHFWMHRRFEVFTKLCQPRPGAAWAEIGCGHGAVQKQLSEKLGLRVDGIDLNDFALQQNESNAGRLLCYDILEKREDFRNAYDHLLLFDVLEHMSDECEFLDATLHMLKPQGSITINVPAFMHFYSQYDVAAGHVRRYDFGAMESLIRGRGLSIEKWTYWGAPLIPLLIMRKAYLRIWKTDNVIRDGFAVRSKLTNSLLRFGARFEWIPQHLHGTSLMVVAKKATG